MPGSRNASASPQLDPTILEAVPFFAGLSRAALLEAAAAGRTHLIPKDAVLFEQGSPADALHLLLQGRLKVVQTTAEGAQTVLRFVGPNQPAGVFALLGPGQLYPATVVAVVDCVVLSWVGAALQAMVGRHPEIVTNAMRALGARAQEAHSRLQEVAAERVERRLALAVLRLIRQAGVRDADGSVRVDFPLARQDLAEMAGTTLPTASRIMSGWEEAGILAAGGRMRVVVKNPHALMRIAEG